LFLIESLKWTDEDELVLSFLKKVEKPVVLVINKVDKVNEKTRLLPFIQRLAEKYKFDEVILISAISGKNVDRLEKCIDSYLPEDHFYFPPAQISNRDLAFQASEIIREKIMRSLEREVPYSAMVQIEKLDETEKFIEICAVIWVEREGQKAILIGKQGNQLKEIGTHARQDMEAHLGQKVVLRLWVKVKKGWSDDASSLKELGIIEDR
jgi:GTP-binding protein Era